MWFLFLLTLINALAHNAGFALRYRIDVAGMPIGVFDFLLGLGVLVALVGRGGAWPAGRLHPLMLWTMLLFGAATAGGIMGALLSNAELRWMMTGMRNWVSLGLSVYIGYNLLLQPRSVARFCYLHVIAGVATAVVILLFFHSAASSLGSQDSLNKLRTMAYVQVYAGLGGALVLFAIIARIRMFPTWAAVLLCGFSFVGLFATLSRSDWVAAIACVAAMYLLLPTFRPGGKVVAAIVGPPIIVAFLWVGLIAASAVTGRDFEAEMVARVESMLPGARTNANRFKAWDSRLEGIQKELRVWRSSPIIGGGFGATDVLRFRYGDHAGLSYRHNSWTSTLAETGVIGFAAVSCLVFGLVVVGRRLARDGVHQAYVLIGALAVITGAFYLIHGMATQSFNQMRWGIPLGIICGAALRARAMQLTEMSLAHDPGYDPAYDASGAGAAYPAYGYDGAYDPYPPAGAHAADSYA